MIDFYKESERIKDELIKIRRDLHEHPELGFEEERTSNVIKDFLRNEGIEFYIVSKTGVCGIIEGKLGEGKTIGVRADIDALPIIDKKNCSYKSKSLGRMHACGHDAHTAILLGSAKILNNNRHLFSGNVKLLFEPAEETTGGAPIMIKEGVLENPKVDCLIGLHVTEDTDCGKIRIKKEMINAASNPFIIKIHGQGAHGAYPQNSIDPIVISAHVITALQTIVSREVAPVNPSVITIGSIHGGTAGNVISDEVIIKGTIRTATKEDRILVERRVREVTSGICNSLRGTADILIEEGYPCLYNDSDMTDLVIASAKELIGMENIVEQLNPSMGVESFAYFANERPSAFYYLGTRNKIKKTDMPAHGSYFDIDEDSLPIGVAMQCRIIVDYLTRT